MFPAALKLTCSGRGGRRFKSCHSDQYLAGPERASPTVFPTVIVPARPIASVLATMPRTRSGV